MNRRELFSTMAAAMAAAALPVAAYASAPVPHVYLARSTRLASGLEHETWLHSTDRGWARTAIFGSEMDYKDRYDHMNELYLWERPRSLKNA
jgi:hypothetical protein